jgi:hypothetical protein
MAQYRALLIGASDYEMRGVSALPFIPGDLAHLGAALRAGGFDEVQVLAGREGGKQVSANYVNGRVTGFLRRARDNDTLFILLSGHGVHAKGHDYLVPEDIDEDTHPFESGCVAIDWRAHLDETPARHVVFLIDACREGIEQESMGVASVRQWSRQKVDAALRRKVAYVYACSPAQLALFVRPHDALVDPVAGIRPGESFSLFSRSVSDVITAHRDSAALTLAEFKEAVQERMTQLHRAYRKRGQPQTVRIVTDIAPDTFAFLPPSSGLPSPARHPLSTGERTGTTTYESTTMNVGVPVPTRPPRRVRRPPGQGSRPPGGPTRPNATSTAAVPQEDTGLDRALRASGSRSPDQILRDLKRSNNELDRAVRGLNRPARWARIAVLICTGAAVIAGTGYALWASRPDGNQRTDNSSGPSASAHISSQQTTPPPRRDTLPELANQSVNTTAIMRLPRCTDVESLEPVTLQLRSERNGYDSMDTPVLILKIKSTSTCRINATPKLVSLAITHVGEDKPLWSSANCSTQTPDRWLAVSASTPATVTYRWNLHRNTSCGEARKAPTGTYLATGDFGSLFVSEAQTSFVVTSD